MKQEFESNNKRIRVFKTPLYDRKELEIRIIDDLKKEAISISLTIPTAKKLSKTIQKLLDNYDLPIKLEQRKKGLLANSSSSPMSF